ncbi:Homoserine dehydrogenase [Vermiconidia calcicola]|uniref:Homoserine dehydrogenase n=1 Tax=Vermiconidia calcicola TaxID=1690605 RepID=A0ACC3N9I6_9PEZI|nr:Homoserine dehydrogenase [Vermiconidia calcicola]
MANMLQKQPIFIAVIGVGGVGKAFLSQYDQLRQRLDPQSSNIDLALILARTSKKQVLSERYGALDASKVPQMLEESNKPYLPFDSIVEFLEATPGKVVLVDNTSDLDLAKSYPRILEKGISIVTPNKKGFSDDIQLWDAIFSSALKGGSHVYHESTVGAGLPVISTLKELVQTGDEVTKIEGVFSGTMSFLFNSFMPVGGGGGKFSAEVKKAKDLGFTEPDPRDDLNGLDVARKLTILARLAGLEIESPTSFPVQSLIPKALESCSSGDEFMEKLPDHDDEMEELKDAAAKEGKVVRFVGSIDTPSGEVKVGLEKFDASHPIAALKGSDNIINFYTKRYGSNPLIIQGAGAGGEVTAMGVTGDLIKVIRLLR